MGEWRREGLLIRAKECSAARSFSFDGEGTRRAGRTEALEGVEWMRFHANLCF